MTIQIVHHDFVGAVADIRRVADALHEERRRVERCVDVLLDGGWSGTSAEAYHEGWDRWRAGCAEVLTALDALADLVAGARVGLVLQDDDVATTFGGAA